MSTMTLDYVSPLFGKAVVERGLRVRCQIKEEDLGAAEAGKDISGARWTYELRAYTGAVSDVFVIRKTLSKHASASASGWLDDYVPMGAVAAAELTWEVIEIDNNNTDATPSVTGKHEVILATWQQSIEDAP